MAECNDNDRLGRFGCGDTYGGEIQHCVAKVSWSDWPDGMAHVTASLSVIDKMWKGRTEPCHPSEIGAVQNPETGRWSIPMGEEAAERLRAIRSSG